MRQLGMNVMRFDANLELITDGGNTVFDDGVFGGSGHPKGLPIQKVWKVCDYEQYLETIPLSIYIPELEPLAGRALLPEEVSSVLKVGTTEHRDSISRKYDVDAEGSSEPISIVALKEVIDKTAPVILPGVIGKNHPRFKLLMDLAFRSGFYDFSEPSGIGTGTSIRTSNTSLLSMPWSWVESVKAYLAKTDMTGICLRCGSTNVMPVHCYRCETTCYSCRECFLSGESTSCTPLFLFPSAGRPEAAMRHQTHLLNLDFSLTPAQKRAYDLTLDFVCSSDNQTALIHAVCGAGKTETVFGGVLSVLNNGGRVLYATPRRDLVRELGVRLKKAFPKTDMLTLYGGSPRKYGSAALITATTHQVMRFYGAFDLVVMDEVDAFPYRGSDRLPKLLTRAKKKNGKVVYITATPDQELLNRGRGTKKRSKNSKHRGNANHRGQDGLELITIPARYHGYPVPTPKLLKRSHQWLFQANAKIPREIEGFFRDYAGSKPVFVFVPTIKLVSQVAAGLKQYFKQKGMDVIAAGTSSKDEQRDEKRAKFFSGDIDILVTTTILERGVTLSGVQVLVLFSHHEIFERRTLIQIAGRAGRTKEDPTGEVLFIGDMVTQDMKAAQKSIDSLNQEAKKLGFIST